MLLATRCFSTFSSYLMYVYLRSEATGMSPQYSSGSTVSSVANERNAQLNDAGVPLSSTYGGPIDSSPFESPGRTTRHPQGS